LNENKITEENKTLEYYDNELDININYTFQSSSKNVIFYKCKKRPNCPGRAKLDIKTKEITIITKCDKNIKHDELKFEEFKQNIKWKILKVLILI